MEPDLVDAHSEANPEMTLAEFIEHKLPKDKGRYARVKYAICTTT